MGIDSPIKAATGYQFNRDADHNEMVDMFIKTMESEDKIIEFIQSSLRTATTISKKGGHVTMIRRDQRFSLKYDNRRLIIDAPQDLNDAPQDLNEFFGSPDYSFDPTSLNSPQPENFNKRSSNYHILLDSNPIEDASTCKSLRYISRKPRKSEFNLKTSSRFKNVYKDYTELATRNFVKGLVSLPRDPNFEKIAEVLNSYDKIINFVKSYNPQSKISKQSISNLKNRKMVYKQIPRSE